MVFLAKLVFNFYSRIYITTTFLLVNVYLMKNMKKPPLKYQIYPSQKISGQASFIPMVFSCLCCYNSLQNPLFCLHQREKSFDSKLKLRQASNRCKRVLEDAKLAYANKTKESVTSQKLGSRDFWQIANSVLNKGKSAIPPLFNRPEVLCSASHKAKLFAENSSKNLILMTQVSLYQVSLLELI